MIKDLSVPLYDVMISSSQVFEFLNPSIKVHQLQVASIAYHIGNELGLIPQQKHNLVLAGALHDIGAFSIKKQMEISKFDFLTKNNHAEIGSYLLQMFNPFSDISSIVKNHHAVWSESSNVSEESFILHLADRIAIAIDPDKYILQQIDSVIEKIKPLSGIHFNPEHVKAFLSLSHKESFWFDIISKDLHNQLKQSMDIRTVELNIDELTAFSHMIKALIDFRSEHTATHSSRVAQTARKLAEFAGFSQKECKFMEIAGNLHDFGKIAIPLEILDKPGNLTAREYSIMRSHSYYTYKILEPISDLNQITAWGAFHHERLDGRGYPFHHEAENLTLGSRIMAVADIFAAVVEDRVYRKGMTKEKVLKVLHLTVTNGGIDPTIVDIIEKNYDTVHSTCMNADRSTMDEYNSFVDFKNRIQSFQ